MNMDAVQASMDKGLQQMKKCLVDMFRGISESSTSELDKAEAKFPIHQWKRCIKAFTAAAELTAHQRYLSWFRASFRGTKRPFDDADYVEDHCGDLSADDRADAGGNDASVSTCTRSKDLPIAATTVSPPINGSQNSKRRNVGAFNDTPNVE
jgi:hypothetical protein